MTRKRIACLNALFRSVNQCMGLADPGWADEQGGDPRHCLSCWSVRKLGEVFPNLDQIASAIQMLSRKPNIIFHLELTEGRRIFVRAVFSVEFRLSIGFRTNR